MRSKEEEIYNDVVQLKKVSRRKEALKLSLGKV